MNPTDARTAPPIYKQYDKAIQYPSSNNNNSNPSVYQNNSQSFQTTRPVDLLNRTTVDAARRLAEEAKRAAEVIKKQAEEKRGTITTGVQESISALTKKQEEERNV